MEVYYNVLEIPTTASQEEIREAYQRMSVKYHPSKNPEYNDKFIEITTAFEKLFKEDISNINSKLTEITNAYKPFFKEDRYIREDRDFLSKMNKLLEQNRLKEVREQPPIKKIGCEKNMHELKFIGGHFDKGENLKHTLVYLCKKCNKMGDIESFTSATI